MAIGHREIEEESVAIRRLGSKEQKTVNINEAIESLQNEIQNLL
jgi:threonyl-tRNA synthetase